MNSRSSRATISSSTAFIIRFRTRRYRVRSLREFFHGERRNRILFTEDRFLEKKLSNYWKIKQLSYQVQTKGENEESKEKERERETEEEKLD